MNKKPFYNASVAVFCAGDRDHEIGLSADVIYRFAGLNNDEQDEKTIGATIFTMAVLISFVSLVIGLILAPFGHPYLSEGISLFDLQLLVFR